MNFRFLAPHNEATNGGGAAIDASKPSLEKFPLRKEIIDEEKIDGFLTAMCNAAEVRKVAGLPDIAFYNEESATYQHPANPKLLQEKNLQQVQITMEDGRHRYFKRLNNDANIVNSAGLKATAYVEIDEAGKIITKDGGAEIRLNFAGYTSPLDDTVQLVETLKEKRGSKIGSLLRDLYDVHVPRSQATKRSLATVDFVHDIIEDWYEKHPEIKVSHLIYGSHSMGAGNALVAQAVSDIEGIPTKTTLAIEQVMAKEQADRVKAALADKNSGLYKKITEVLGSKYERDDLERRIAAEPEKLEQDINNGHTYSIHAFTFKKNGAHKSSISTVMNAGETFGTEILQDVSEASHDKKIVLWAEHKLKALLETARDGNYYSLNLSRATDIPKVIMELNVSHETDQQQAMITR